MGILCVRFKIQGSAISCYFQLHCSENEFHGEEKIKKPQTNKQTNREIDSQVLLTIRIQKQARKSLHYRAWNLNG